MDGTAVERNEVTVTITASRAISAFLKKRLAIDGYWKNGYYLNTPDAKPFIVAIEEFYGIRYKIITWDRICWSGDLTMITWALLEMEFETE